MGLLNGVGFHFLTWQRERLKLVDEKESFFWGESAGGGGVESCEQEGESSAFPQSANS
jgi:hypothetical protein